jgi:hypothetical protein
MNFCDIPALTENPITVEIDIYDFTGPGATAAFLYDFNNTVLLDSDSNSQVGTKETLFLSGAPGANLVVLSSFETFVDEARLNVVPLPSATLFLGSGLIALVGLRNKLKQGSP